MKNIVGDTPVRYVILCLAVSCSCMQKNSNEKMYLKGRVDVETSKLI